MSTEFETVTELPTPPALASVTLLEDMASECRRTARLRRCLWGDNDIRADVWDSCAKMLDNKIKSVSMSSNAVALPTASDEAPNT